MKKFREKNQSVLPVKIFPVFKMTYSYVVCRNTPLTISSIYFTLSYFLTFQLITCQNGQTNFKNLAANAWQGWQNTKTKIPNINLRAFNLKYDKSDGNLQINTYPRKLKVKSHALLHFNSVIFGWLTEKRSVLSLFPNRNTARHFRTLKVVNTGVKPTRLKNPWLWILPFTFVEEVEIIAKKKWLIFLEKHLQNLYSSQQRCWCSLTNVKFYWLKLYLPTIKMFYYSGFDFLTFPLSLMGNNLPLLHIKRIWAN